MKRTGIRLTALFLCVFLSAALFGCDRKKPEVWDGFENADLSAYVTPGNYKGLPYHTVTPVLGDAEVTEALQAFLLAHEYEADITDRAAVLGDLVKAEYHLKVDEKEIPLYTGSGDKFTAGEETALPGISAFGVSLTGHTAGDSYVVSCDFAEDFKPEGDTAGVTLAGAHGELSVTVLRVYEMRIPEPDDAFFATIKDGLTAESFLTSLREELFAKKEAEAKETMRAEVWDAVMAASAFLSYPEDEIDSRKSKMHTYYEECARASGMTLADYLKTLGYTESALSSLEEKYAKNAVAESLLLYSIARAEKIFLSDEEYRQGLSLCFRLYGGECKDEAEYEMKTGKNALFLVLLHDKVTDFMLENGISSAEETETTAETSAA